ncbi:MAG: hypothetical protein N3B14_05875 [Thermoleophilia bacterium]|nr:hypothetical protein [Thermoleophilia bacterium]
MLARDQALDLLRYSALLSWQPTPWSRVETESFSGLGRVEGALEAIPGCENWALEATVRHDPQICALAASAWVERGRDGLDLPFAAVVATEVMADPTRSQVWLQSDLDTSSADDELDTSSADEEKGPARPAVAYLTRPETVAPIAENCQVLPLEEPWSLDGGWRTAVSLMAEIQDTGFLSETGDRVGVVAEEGVFLIQARTGRRVSFPEKALHVRNNSEPVLVVLTGGADLDARGLGLVRAVVVVDEGSILLDGTTVCGAVMATGTVDVGESGTVVFCPAVLRWATDCSLRRARLVPGSRWESSTGG